LNQRTVSVIAWDFTVPMVTIVPTASRKRPGDSLTGANEPLRIESQAASARRAQSGQEYNNALHLTERRRPISIGIHRTYYKATDE
jgi:hypothetical protein